MECSRRFYEFLTPKRLGFVRTLTRSSNGRVRSREKIVLPAGSWILVDGLGVTNRLRGRACQQQGGQRGTGHCNIGPAGTRHSYPASESHTAVHRLPRSQLSTTLHSPPHPPI